MSNQEMDQMQQSIWATQAAKAERESYLFMKRHIHDFVPCEANSNILTQFIVANKLEWDQDSLDIAYEAEKSKLVKQDPAYRPQLEPQPTTQAKDDLPPAPPGVTWPETKSQIQQMSQTDYRREFHSLKTGAAFRARINAVLARGV
jgi:hypothetical protein